MNLRLTLIGFITIIIGCIITGTIPAITYIGAPLIFIGVFLFAGLYSEDIFIDYVTFENENYIFSVRKRSYYHFFPFTIIFSIFKTDIKFIYKVDYYKFVTPDLESKEANLEQIKIKRTEYKALLQDQKQQYNNKLVPQEIVADICAPEKIRVKLAKARYIIWLALTLLSLTGVTVPSDWWLVIILVSLFGTLTIFRYTEYKQAEFKDMVYNNYLKKTND